MPKFKDDTFEKIIYFPFKKIFSAFNLIHVIFVPLIQPGHFVYMLQCSVLIPIHIGFRSPDIGE